MYQLQHAGYSAQFDINAKQTTKKEESEAKEFNSYRERRSIFQVGGRPPTDPNNGSAIPWAHTVEANPLPIRYTLVEISSLFTPEHFSADPNIETKQALLNNAIDQYCGTILALTYCDSNRPLPAPRIKTVPNSNVTKFGNNVFY